MISKHEKDFLLIYEQKWKNRSGSSICDKTKEEIEEEEV